MFALRSRGYQTNEQHRIIGTYVGIFGVIAIVLGRLVHVFKADPSGVETVHISIAIPRFEG